MQRSADAIDDDQWWLEEDGCLDEGSITESRKVSSSKKKKTIEEVSVCVCLQSSY